jgi:hypothetical protein
MSVKRLMGKLLEPKRGEETGGWGKCIMKSCISVTFYKILLV